MNNFESHKIDCIERNNFVLNNVELDPLIDFEVKRVYYITNTSEEVFPHSHKEQKEFFIMVQGTCELEFDKGEGLEEIKLNGSRTQEDDAVFVNNLVWHHFKDFSDNAILLALSSKKSSSVDYIKDYDKFLKVRDE
ncbi:MAG: FdtA/QdtA family cupin domain-containing protein [Candidatus Magasanikbacteria bacterium]